MLAGFGLFLDIVGVCLLLWASSVKRIEAELTFNMMKSLTDQRQERRKAGELVERSELDTEEHKHRLSRTEQIVRRNHRCWRFALALVLLGFPGTTLSPPVRMGWRLFLFLAMTPPMTSK